MIPYSANPHTKGLAGCRRSCDTPHRKRCLRVDKKAARREAKNMTQGWAQWDNEMCSSWCNMMSWH